MNFIWCCRSSDHPCNQKLHKSFFVIVGIFAQQAPFAAKDDAAVVQIDAILGRNGTVLPGRRHLSRLALVLSAEINFVLKGISIEDGLSML